MFAMFAQFFAMFTKLFSAAEKGASAIDHLATWADESAGSFADEARITRTAKSNKLQRESALALVNNPATSQAA